MMRSLEVPLEIMSMKIVVAVLCSPFGHNMRHDSWIKGHILFYWACSTLSVHAKFIISL